jgi:hypothetical protein
MKTKNVVGSAFRRTYIVAVGPAKAGPHVLFEGNVPAHPASENGS